MIDETIAARRLEEAIAALEAKGAGPVKVQMCGAPPDFTPREKYTRSPAEYVAAAFRAPDGSTTLLTVTTPSEPLPEAVALNQNNVRDDSSL